MNLPIPEPYCEIARHAGNEAGALLLSYFEKLDQNSIEQKSNLRDLLTEADTKSEKLVTHHIQRQFPEHSILGEEQGLLEGKGEEGRDFCWIIDPLDGTTNFARGYPFFACSIALLYRGIPLVGVIEAPYLNESFWAAKDQGAYLNGRQLKVSNTSELQRSLLATGFGYNRNQVTRNNVDNFARLVLETHDLRRGGAASLDLAHVATGRLDGYWEAYLKPWDVAAGALLVQEAGGKVSDYTGSEAELDWLWQENIIATNNLVHDQLKNALSGREEGYQPHFKDFAERWHS